VYVDFPADAEMNTVVANVDKNIGITVLTEAAWSYLRALGADAWKDPAKVIQASEAIRGEFNRFLPVGMQVEDITRLPVLLNDRTPDNSIDATRSGTYGLVSSGLARAAGLLRVGDTAAALKVTRQMGADLCDGVLDGACKGMPVVTNAADLAYLVPQFGEFLNAGVGDIATGCGTDASKDSSLRIVQIKMDPTFPPELDPSFQQYRDNTPLFLLRNDGKVFFWSTRASDPVPYAPELTFRQLFPQGDLLGATNLGRVHVAPIVAVDSSLPPADQVAVALPPQERVAFRGSTTVRQVARSITTGDAQIVRMNDGRPYVGFGDVVPTPFDLENVVSIGVAANPRELDAFFAVTADGRGFAWGGNGGGALGLGLPCTDITCLPGEIGDQLTPAQIPIPGAPALVSITGHFVGAFAITRAGDVWGWGGVNPPFPAEFGRGNLPVPATAWDPFKPITQIECTNSLYCIALNSKGEMLVVDFRTQSADRTVTKVALPAGAKAVFVSAAARFIVYGLLDTGTAVLFANNSKTPIFIEPGKLNQSMGNTCSGPRS
jgi:hypothetical protein